MPNQTLLHTILAPGGLSTVFQPIYEIQAGQIEIFALEALTRGPKLSNLERAEVLFEYVRRKSAEPAVDRACIELALREAARIPLNVALSINVHVATLERDEAFDRFLAGCCEATGINPSRIVLEIVEQQRYWDATRFHRMVRKLRDDGVRIALDDVGRGNSNYRMMVEVRPDFVKVDRYFVEGCDVNAGALSAIESMVLLATRLGGRVIGEGIEATAELAAVTDLGIGLVQGFLLGRPRTACEFINDAQPGPRKFASEINHVTHVH
ncbi:MAG TPA: EAL domain-containing protein [Thermoanaerobaculia bacterium]|nr:EAL domain-containing protein [Thermoanaerobaculia bacterium]